MEVDNMTNSPVGNDPRLIWQGQNVSGQTVPAREIRARAQKLAARARRRRFVFGAAFILYFAFSIVVLASSSAGNALHVGWVAVVRFALLIVWVLSWRYYIADRPIRLDLKSSIVVQRY